MIWKFNFCLVPSNCELTVSQKRRLRLHATHFPFLNVGFSIPGPDSWYQRKAQAQSASEMSRQRIWCAMLVDTFAHACTAKAFKKLIATWNRPTLQLLPQPVRQPVRQPLHLLVQLLQPQLLPQRSDVDVQQAVRWGALIIMGRNDDDGGPWEAELGSRVRDPIDFLKKSPPASLA